MPDRTVHNGDLRITVWNGRTGLEPLGVAVDDSNRLGAGIRLELANYPNRPAGVIQGQMERTFGGATGRSTADIGALVIDFPRGLPPVQR